MAVASADAGADARGKLEKLRDEKGRGSSLSFLLAVTHAIRSIRTQYVGCLVVICQHNFLILGQECRDWPPVVERAELDAQEVADGALET